MILMYPMLGLNTLILCHVFINFLFCVKLKTENHLHSLSLTPFVSQGKTSFSCTMSFSSKVFNYCICNYLQTMYFCFVCFKISIHGVIVYMCSTLIFFLQDSIFEIFHVNICRSSSFILAPNNSPWVYPPIPF